MECPNCGLFNPATAQRCDCGFDFASRTVRGSFLSPRELQVLSADPYRYGSGWLGLLGRLFGWVHGRITGETARRRKLEDAYTRSERFGPPES
jgi:hypothetical protein